MRLLCKCSSVRCKGDSGENQEKMTGEDVSYRMLVEKKIEKRVFGQTKEGRDVLCWRIDASWMRLPMEKMKKGMLSWDIQQETRVSMVMGRFANRILGKRLSGGFCGFDRKIWDSKAVENGVRFRLFSPDGEEGYPGNLKVQVDVIVKNGALELLYQAETDEDTVLNLTNHCFNLDEGNTVKDHLLMINSDRLV